MNGRLAERRGLEPLGIAVLVRHRLREIGEAGRVLPVDARVLGAAGERGDRGDRGTAS